MTPPPQVIWIINTLNAHGYEAAVVGGSVRDALMGLAPKDWDLATSALPAQVKQIFPQTFDTGIQHGTVTVVLQGSNYEITTFRTESDYTDHRRPDAVFYTENLLEDLKRRDFTMNAIAWYPDKDFFDPFNGMEDISRKIIRGVGMPEKRFQEDALRMLRAIRFAGQLGFQLEEKTWKALLQNAKLIVHISAERVRDEFVKLLLSPRPDKILLLNESKLLFHFQPPLDSYLQSFTPNLPALSLCPLELPLRLALILEKALEDELKRILSQLHFDNKTIKNVLTLTYALRQETPVSPYGIRKQLAQMGSQAYEQLLCLRRIQNRVPAGEVTVLEKAYRQVTEKQPCLSIKALAVNGNDLKALGFEKGEMLGQALHTLFEAVLEKPERNTRDNLLELAAQILENS